MTGEIMKTKRRAGVTGLIAGALMLTGSAIAQQPVNDPFEGFNRAMFSVNEGLDLSLIHI